ncbi:MAG: hypothetical protein ACREM6_05080 [Vulcanimicrobiaceae bacterium]
MTIERAFAATRAGIIEKATKTETTRTIPLGSLGLDAVRRQRVLQAQDRLASSNAHSAGRWSRTWRPTLSDTRRRD